jgi:hypothetical protein
MVEQLYRWNPKSCMWDCMLVTSIEGNAKGRAERDQPVEWEQLMGHRVLYGLGDSLYMILRTP